jgi:hypothetical protein
MNPEPLTLEIRRMPQPLDQVRQDVIDQLRADVKAGAGHDCSEWLRRGTCLLCDRTLVDIRGPKMADVEAAILGFNAHGLEPHVATVNPGEDPGDADLLVTFTTDGAVADVRLTDHGLARLRATPTRELTLAEASAAAAKALEHALAGRMH